MPVAIGNRAEEIILSQVIDQHRVRARSKRDIPCLLFEIVFVVQVQGVAVGFPPLPAAAVAYDGNNSKDTNGFNNQSPAPTPAQYKLSIHIPNPLVQPHKSKIDTPAAWN